MELVLGQRGKDAQQTLDSQDVVQTTQVVAQGQIRSPNVEGQTVDARLITLADLQAQGRTPTESTEEEAAKDDIVGGSKVYIYEDAAGIAEAICAYPWPQGCDYWIGIARCESTLGQDPWAYDDRNPYIGLFQVDEAHGYGREWLKDDANNTLAAWELSHEGTRTSPWPYCQWQ